jgi:hypothetical protein
MALAMHLYRFDLHVGVGTHARNVRWSGSGRLGF